MEGMKTARKILVGKSKFKGTYGALRSINRRITLRQSLRKQVVRLCPGFIWFRNGTSGRLLLAR